MIFKFTFEDSKWLQWVGAIGAHLVLFVSGLVFGWSSPYLAQLTSADSTLPITMNEASWVASLVSLARLFGAVIGAIALQYLGGGKAVLSIGLPFVVSWISLIVADSVIWLYVSRISSGISIGMVYSSLFLFLGEISSPEIRGALVTLSAVGAPLGVFCANIIGAYVTTEIFSYISLVPTIIFIVIFLWIPESPHHLVKIGKLEAAKTSLLKYNPRANVEIEIAALERFMSTSSSVNFVDRLREFKTRCNQKSVIIVVLLFTFLSFSGFNSVTFYMEIILIDAKLTVIKPAEMVIIVGVIGIVAALTAMFIADKFGRRLLLACTSAGLALSMVALGVHFILIKYNGFDASELQWLPIASLLVYQACLFLGVAPVANIIMSELFAPSIKSIAACITSLVGALAGFVSTKTYQPLVDLVGEAYVFWMHALIMLLEVIFALVIMPETRGKSLQEIQNNLMKKRTV